MTKSTSTQDLLKRIEELKAVEEGRLSVEELIVESDKDKFDRELSKRINTVVMDLENAIGSNEWEANEVIEDLKAIPEVSLPILQKTHPYTSVLLLIEARRGSLAPDQAKSPYADQFPGVSVDAVVVENEAIDVDLEFADLAYLRMLVAPDNWKSTGLYAPAGENVTIVVPDGLETLDIQVGAHTDKLGHLPNWDRAPIVVYRESLKPGENIISSPFGGLIYLIPTKSEPNRHEVITISGAIRAPYFVLGKTTNEEWNETVKNYPAPWAEFAGDHVIHTLPSDVVREIEDPETLMNNWDDFVRQYDQLVGLKDDAPLPHRTPGRPHRYTADTQISAGYMHAGYPMMVPIKPAARHIVDFDRVKDLHDGWGYWHEMGHEYQQVAWFWNDIVEVSVNIYSLYIQDYYGAPSRLFETDKDGRNYYDIAFEFLKDENPDKNFNEIGLFERLVMIRQLQIGYGWEFFTNLHIAYRELPEEELPAEDDEQAKIDLFVVMCSKVSGDSLINFYKTWGMPFTDEAVERVAALDLPEPKQKLTALIEERK